MGGGEERGGQRGRGKGGRERKRNLQGPNLLMGEVDENRENQSLVLQNEGHW